MTANEAKEFLIACSKQWEQPKQQIRAYVEWQRHASREELEEVDAWHKQYLSECPYPISTDEDMLDRNRRWILQSIENNSGNQGFTAVNKKNSYIWLKIAAILVIAMGLFWILQYYQSAQSPLQNNTAAGNLQESQLLNPGRSQGVLTLASGRRILLDSLNKDINIDGVQIKQMNMGVIAFKGIKSDNNSYNSLTTPVGGLYQIVLPDGSQIWLNSNSSLHFPTKFDANKREVTFSGEGYFEIKHNDKAPFLVKVGKMNIKVLGTGFNIKAYENEAAIKTTLVHGSIDVKSGANEHIISAGEQIILKKENDKLSIIRPNIEQEIAWKKGIFWFNKTSIYDIMRQIERWYNVKIDYEGDLSGAVLTGKLSKMQNAADLLDILEATKEVKFKIQGHTIKVAPYLNK